MGVVKIIVREEMGNCILQLHRISIQGYQSNKVWGELKSTQFKPIIIKQPTFRLWSTVSKQLQ